MIQICIYIQYIHGKKVAFCELLLSLPTWKCGLKFQVVHTGAVGSVTSYVEVWIEMMAWSIHLCSSSVTA